MKKRLVLILIAALMVISLTSCLDKDKMEEAFEEGRRSAYEDDDDSVKKEEVSEEETEEETEAKEEVKEDDLSDVRYAEDFKQASYKEYGSKDADSSLEGNPIYVKGEITDYEEDQNALVLEADDGEWIVDFGSDMSDEIKKELKGYKGEKVRVFGTFKGYSKAWSKPVITIIKDVPKYACRMEDLDGKDRITYLDTQWEMKEADKDYTVGSLSFKGISSWEMEYSDEETTFVPLAGYTGMITISRMELPEAYAGWKDDEAEDVLDNIAEQYMEGAEIHEQKKTNAGGLNAIRYITTIPDDDYPSEMAMYVILGKDAYYAVMFGEPFLLGTAMSDYEEVFMDSLKTGEPESTPDKEDKKDQKEEKDAQKPDKEKEKEPANKEEKTETKRSGYPSKSEIMGKTFTWHAEGQTVENGEISSVNQDSVVRFDSSDMANYSEATGETTFSDGETAFLIDFSYDSKGRIVYSGQASYNSVEISGYANVSGREQ